MKTWLENILLDIACSKIFLSQQKDNPVSKFDSVFYVYLHRYSGYFSLILSVSIFIV